MSKFACARCSWRAPATDPGTPPVTVRDHEQESGHPTCQLCAHSLQPDEAMTCLACVARVHQTLTDITELTRELHAQLGHPAAQVYDSGPRTDDGPPIPGGTVMTLVSPGSMGTAARHVTTREAQRGAEGREHGADNRPTDPPSVAFELARWEDDWRAVAGHAPAMTQPTVRTAAAYLTTHVDWASREHPAFVEFARDIRQLRATLRTATGHDDRPLRADVRCLDCDTRLERDNRPPSPCDSDHVHDDVLCDQGGLTDTWSCPKCAREYTGQSYMFAVRQQIEAGGSRDKPARRVPAKRSESYPDMVIDHRSGHQILDAG